MLDKKTWIGRHICKNAPIDEHNFYELAWNPQKDPDTPLYH